MSLKFKFLFLFVIVAIVPIIIAGILTFRESKDELTRQITEKLVAVADVQEKRLNETLDRNLEIVRLLASRVQLRVNLSEYNRTGNPVALDEIKISIEEAEQSILMISEILIYNSRREVVATTGNREERWSSAPAWGQVEAEDYQLRDVFKDKNNQLRAQYLGPLILDGQVIGFLEITMRADFLISVTEDYSGLGDTGEVVLAKRNRAGDALYLTSLRFDSGAALTRAVPGNNINAPIISALKGQEDIFKDSESVDYRDKSIFAVTRFIEALDWGLVVKIDQAEALSPVNTLFGVFIGITTIVLVIAVILSYFFSRTISKPIIDLTGVARSLEAGDFSVRASGHSNDETGLLGQAFNSMANKLQESYRGLEEKIWERTQQLQTKKAKDEAILASLGDGLIVTDEKGNIILLNKSSEEMLGWKQSEVVNKSLVKTFLLEDESGRPVPENERLIVRAISDGKRTSSDKYYYVRRDKTRFPVNIVANPFKSGNKIIGSVQLFQNITQLKAVDKAKTEFVSLASHQLRTPLSTVNWYAEMLLDGDVGILKKEQKDYVEEIYTGNKRMVELVNALLNVSRIEMGTFAVDPESTDLGSLLKSVADELQLNIKNKKIDFSISVDSKLSTVSADPKIMRIVFQNLLTNAIKYTPEGGVVKADICFKRAGEIIGENPLDKDSFLITVSDTGWGIPDNQKNQIFTKLFRADNVREKDTEGTGLGLYIIKSIIKHAGGHIWFESPYFGDSSGGKTLIQGTKFSILFPKTGMVAKSGAKPLEAQNKV